MKRNAKSTIRFTPKAQLRSLQSVIDNYSLDEHGLERAFCVYNIMRQIILDLQRWNTPVFNEEERDKTLRYMAKHEGVNIDLFCGDFISCATAYPNIEYQIEEIIKE